jgi:vacuolar-type H+-ATPase subunit H
MSDRDGPTKDEAARAMEEVLAAERAAREAIEACRTSAESTLEAAREDARRITRRATSRITRLHARCEQIAAARIAELREELNRDPPHIVPDAADLASLEAAAARLAARLTGNGRG